MMRVNDVGYFSASEVAQIGVSVRKVANWADERGALEPGCYARIVERTKETGAELIAAIKFSELLDQMTLIAEVTRRYDDSVDEPDEVRRHTTWLIDSVDGDSITLSPLVEDAAAIRVPLMKDLVAHARPGWMLAAAAERRGSTWNLIDTGDVVA